MGIQPTKSTWGKWGLLASLYLSQGLPYGFFYQALPVLMRKSGISLEAIGLSSLVALPWMLKFLWAPFMDRYGIQRWGLRKGWILPLQALMAVVMVLAAFIEPSQQMTLLLVVVFVMNFLSATQDVATDGLAVDILSYSERGIANGIQVAAYRLGMVLAGGILLTFYDTLGWRLSFFILSGLIALSSLPVWAFQEKAQPLSAENHSPIVSHFFFQEGTWPLLIMLFAFKFGESFASAMLKPFFTDAGLTMGDIGFLLGTVGFTCGLVGALLGGFLVTRVRRHSALIFAASLQAISVGLYAYYLDEVPSRGLLAFLLAFEHVASGMATAALFTCMMDFCRPGFAGADYTAQASTVVLAQMLSAALSGFSAKRLGYVGHFSFSFALCVVAVVLAVAFLPRKGPEKK